MEWLFSADALVINQISPLLSFFSVITELFLRSHNFPSALRRFEHKELTRERLFLGIFIDSNPFNRVGTELILFYGNSSRFFLLAFFWEVFRFSVETSLPRQPMNFITKSLSCHSVSPVWLQALVTFSHFELNLLLTWLISARLICARRRKTIKSSSSIIKFPSQTLSMIDGRLFIHYNFYLNDFVSSLLFHRTTHKRNNKFPPIYQSNFISLPRSTCCCSRWRRMRETITTRL